MSEQNPHVAKRRRIAEAVASRLSRVTGITSIAIIGSVATGEARADSDLDLAATYRDSYDQQAFDAACDEIGRDPTAITSSTDPSVSMTGLLVNGVHIGLMVGSEHYLAELGETAATIDAERYNLAFRSYAEAVVLFDPEGIWPSTIEAVRDAERRLFGSFSTAPDSVDI